MSKLLCIYENRIATVSTLCDFLTSLSAYEKRVEVRNVSISDLKSNDIQKCDVLVMIRPNNAVFARIARIARSAEKFIIAFLDDDLINLPKGNADMPWRKKGLILSLKVSSLILSSNQRILEKYGILSGVSRTVLLDTAVSDKSIVLHKSGNEKIKLVYAAGAGHYVLFDKYIKPIISRLDEKVGDIVSLTFMGVHPDLNKNDYRMEIEYIEPMPLDQYRKTIAAKNFDIGLAPLEQTEFSSCKYFNKFIEYSMFGIVGVYSNVAPYTLVIRHEENGVLTDNSSEGWFNTLVRAIQNRELVENCRNGAYATLKERFDPVKIMDGIIRDIPELVEEHLSEERTVNSIVPAKVLYSFSRICDWAYKSVFYLAKGGVKELYCRIRNHLNIIRKMKS